MSNEDLDAIEKEHGVNIEVTDEDGCTTVYAYTVDLDRVGFRFITMNPELADVQAAASAVAILRRLANVRPRIGKACWCWS